MVQCPRQHPCCRFFILGVPLALLARVAHHSSPPCERSITHTVVRHVSLWSSPILRERAIRLDGPFFVCAASKTLPELIKGSDSPFPEKALACYSRIENPNPSCIFNRLVLHRHRRINPSMVHRPARHPCLALFTLGVPLAPLVRYTHRSSPSVGPAPCERSITHTVVRHVSLWSSPIQRRSPLSRVGFFRLSVINLRHNNREKNYLLEVEWKHSDAPVRRSAGAYR